MNSEVVAQQHKRWLAPQNFDTENRQKMSLVQLRGSAP
jgi:hypothetical protein